MAKKTSLIAVKVLNAEGSGSLSNVVAGLEWVVNDATSKQRKYLVSYWVMDVSCANCL